MCVCLCVCAYVHQSPRMVALYSPLSLNTQQLSLQYPPPVNVPEQNDSLIISVSFKLMVIFFASGKRKKTDCDF